jgi:hypothetical protein
MTKSKHLPVARKEGLLIERLSDEVLIYDLARKKAHCLNQAAALIWDHCDGKTSVAELTRVLKDQSCEAVDEDVVWFALDRLEKSHLLSERIYRPNDVPGLTRRQLIRRVGLAVSVPLVISILAPTASASLSCVGRLCAGNPTVCGPCTCNGTTCT